MYATTSSGRPAASSHLSSRKVIDHVKASLLKRVIHDWDDERAGAILRNCHRAMPEHGRLLVIELVLPPGNDPSLGKLFDLLMLVDLGGRERTEADYRTLLAGAGFELAAVTPTPSLVSVIEGVRR